MEINCANPSLLESRQGKGCQWGRQKSSLTTELFLDEYPRWEIEGPYWSIILHDMFLHAAKEGQKEAERFICQGHWQSLPRLDPEADIPAITLSGVLDLPQRDQRPLPWCISAKKVTQVCLPCGPQARGKMQSRTSCPPWGATCIVQTLHCHARGVPTWGAAVATPSGPSMGVLI